MIQDITSNKPIQKIVKNSDTSQTNQLSISTIDTPLGKMMAVGNENALYFLGFEDQDGSTVEQLEKKSNSKVVSGHTKILNSIEQELALYFSGKLQKFKTPLSLVGTSFQKDVWIELQKIPYATTKSYKDLSINIEKPTAYRAVAQANSANNICIIIPCHRVINSNGGIGGYSGKLWRKEWLLDHEKKYR